MPILFLSKFYLYSLGKRNFSKRYVFFSSGGKDSRGNASKDCGTDLSDGTGRQLSNIIS